MGDEGGWEVREGGEWEMWEVREGGKWGRVGDVGGEGGWEVGVRVGDVGGEGGWEVRERDGEYRVKDGNTCIQCTCMYSTCEVSQRDKAAQSNYT